VQPDPTTPQPEIEGLLVEQRTLTRPWPSMLRGINGDPERHRETYWRRFPGLCFAGDGAKRDEDADASVVETIRDNTGTAEE